MSTTKKASRLEVGDVMLVGHSPIGSLSLTTGKCYHADGTRRVDRDEGGGYDEECLIVAVEETTEDGYPKDWVSVDEYGPQPVIAVTYFGDTDRERTSHYSPDDEVRVKDPYA